MSGPWEYALAVGPLGFYLGVLAVWHGGRRPKVVRGLTDFTLLAASVVGLLAFGPAAQALSGPLFGGDGPADHWAVASVFGLVACGFALRSIDRVVVYAVAPENLTRALDDVLGRLAGPTFVRTLGGYEDRAAPRGLRVECGRVARCATVEAFGPGAAELMRAVRVALKARLRAEPAGRSPLALPLAAASVLVLLSPLAAGFAARSGTGEVLRALLRRLGWG